VQVLGGVDAVIHAHLECSKAHAVAESVQVSHVGASVDVFDCCLSPNVLESEFVVENLSRRRRHCSYVDVSSNCITPYHLKTFQFSDFTVINKKTTYTVSLGNPEEDIVQHTHGLSIYPNGAKNPIYRKSRNE
jgi:hypothetical protein